MYYLSNSNSNFTEFLADHNSLEIGSLKTAKAFLTYDDAFDALSEWIKRFSKVNNGEILTLHIVEKKERIVVSNKHGEFLAHDGSWGSVSEAIVFRKAEDAFSLVKKLCKLLKDFFDLGPQVVSAYYFIIV